MKKSEKQNKIPETNPFYHMDISDCEECVIFTIKINKNTPETLEFMTDDFMQLLHDKIEKRAIVDIRSLTLPLTIFEEFNLAVNLASQVPDETQIGLLARHIDNEDVAFIVKRFLREKNLFLGVFREQSEAIKWLKGIDNALPNNHL